MTKVREGKADIRAARSRLVGSNMAMMTMEHSHGGCVGTAKGMDLLLLFPIFLDLDNKL